MRAAIVALSEPCCVRREGSERGDSLERNSLRASTNTCAEGEHAV